MYLFSASTDVECGWCKRPVSLSSPDFLTSPEGPRYCTESCFSQSRRASFKRAKTCDWCKHVRHAVSYVDFLDGASQLQFCSDKCLNQYKMQIFCKETQAHLDMNPHLMLEKAGDPSKDGKRLIKRTFKINMFNIPGALITPELWLKNCKSRSTSPMSDRSRSRSPSSSAKPPHKPIITLAPSSKLLSRPPLQTAVFAQTISPKATRKRRSLRQCNSVILRNSSLHLNRGSNDTPTAPPTTTLQDLTTNAQHRNISNHRMSFLKNSSPKPIATNSQFLPPPPNLYPIRSPSAQSQPTVTSFAPTSSDPATIVYTQTTTTTTSTPSPIFPQSESIRTSTTNPPNTHLSPFPFGANPPPITILVPYPVMVPVPFPIPIPMPIMAFLRAAQVQLDAKNGKPPPPSANGNGAAPSQHNPSQTTNDGHSEQPLDCSKSRDELFDDDDPEQLIEVICEDSSDSITEIPSQTTPVPSSSHSTQPAKPHSGPSSANNNASPLLTEKSKPNYTQTSSSVEQQPLPKFKITRLNSRRGIITPSSASQPSPVNPSSTDQEAADAPAPQPSAAVDQPAPMLLETSRPLRKRKRLVDCDYSRAKAEDMRK